MRKSVLAGGGVVAVMLAIALLVQQCTAGSPEVPRDATRAAAPPAQSRG